MQNNKLIFEPPIAIIGWGVSGKASYQLLLELGYASKDLLSFDQKKGPQDYQDFESLFKQAKPRTLLVSPGVPLANPWIQSFKASGGTLTSEIDLACRLLSDEKIVAITGSVGKSTTTALVGEAAKQVDPHCFVGGNLGTPLASYLLSVRQKIRPKARWLVVELSSYQLENAATLLADYSIITNLSPNHLERYSTIQDYYATKLSLINKTKNLSLLNHDGGELSRQSVHGKIQWVSPLDKENKALALRSKLLGKHNLENVSLALSLSRILAWPPSSTEAILSFQGLAHRLENLEIHNGVWFINDSKATSIESVLSALQAVEPRVQNKLHVLLGGRDKKLPWEQLGGLVNNKKLVFWFFGECAERAQQGSALPGQLFPSLDSALGALFSRLEEGDTVLLSPGGSSLDEFASFEARGNFLKEQIKARWLKLHR